MSAFTHDDAVNLVSHVGRGSVALAYLDPPFFVGIKFRARDQVNKGERAHGLVAYSDQWPSFDVYLDWLTERVRAVHDALSDTGAMWLHLDQRAVHDMKVRADQVFGRDRFLGEVIWVPGNGGRRKHGPPQTHQTILVYTKSDTYTWNADDPMLREPYAGTSQKMHFTHKDQDGRAYRVRTINGKTYRYALDRGRALGSVWSDCPSMMGNTPLLSEATGYPTQKPEKLLTRIIRAQSHPGDLVCDPFMGSGTTLVCAHALGRRFFGMDVGEHSVSVVRARLSEHGAPFDVRPPAAEPRALPLPEPPGSEGAPRRPLPRQTAAEPTAATPQSRGGRARRERRSGPAS
jgi:site-specific DNA-methyltransferase (adenine-specific)